LPDNPPLGPTGQPNPSNPFQQGASANLSINTSQAQKAMEDFQRSLDSMIKSFGGSWHRVANDRLAAEERLYRAIGDKARARQAELKRYSNEAIALIEEESKANIRKYEQEKHSQDELLRYKTSTEKKAADEKFRINKEVAQKLASEGGVGGRIRGFTSSIGQQIGGPIGGIISGAGAILTNPYALSALAILEALNAKAAFTATGAQLAGAGFGLGAGAGVGFRFDRNLFGGPAGDLGQAFSAEQQRQIIGTMSGSRTMIDQARASGGFDAIRGNLGLFANILPDASKEMELFTDATKSLGMSQKDITNTFVSSRVNADRLNITQLDAIRTQMEMQKALRNITNDGTVASSVLFNITDYLKSIKASEVERQRIGGAIVQAGANVSLPQIMGMFGFIHGGVLPTEQDIFGVNGKGGLLRTGGTFNLLGSFMQKVAGQASPAQRFLVENQLLNQLVPGLRLQDQPQAFRLMEDLAKGKLTDPRDMAQRFKALEGKTPATAAAEGIKTLANIVDPIKKLENVFSNFWTMLDDRINQIVSHFPGLHGFHLTSSKTPTPRDIARFHAPADYYKTH
jgi:hypothetical protein